MLKNGVSIICKEGKFKVGILLEQVAAFEKCNRCERRGAYTYLFKIKKLVNISTKKEIGIRTRFGNEIKKILLEKFNGRYLCENCATGKWKITVHK